MESQHLPELEATSDSGGVARVNQLRDQVASLCLGKSCTKQSNGDKQLHKLGLNQLCKTCVDDIFPNDGEWVWLQENFNKKPDEEKLIGPFALKRLLEAVKAGCHFCTIVSDSINQMGVRLHYRGIGSLWETQERYFLLPHHRSEECAWFEIDFKLGFKLGYQNFSIGVSPVTSLDQEGSYQYSDWRKEEIVQNQSHTNLGEQPFAQVRQWLQLCQQTHKMCNIQLGSESQSGRPPVRFVDLGVDTTRPVRLVDHQLTEDDKPVYITLSYRWTAEIERSQTTQANKHLHYDAMPVSEWPKVYKDAASLARRLGVRYLWIDALCIIQGDHKDWDEQSQMMDMVYTNGLLNLAAILGEESFGLESFRDPLSVMPCVVGRVSNDGNEAGEIRHWIVKMEDGGVFESFIPSAPLYKRGWTLQERALSTRTLHCGKQLYWECMTSKASEVFPGLHLQDRNMLNAWGQNPIESLKRVLSDVDLFQAFSSEKDPRPPPPPHSRHMRHHRQPGLDYQKRVVNIWNEVVEAFSAMSLTKASDKLVALRGIVNRLQSPFGHADGAHQYVSGLWKIEIYFELQLCWTMTQRHDPVWQEPDHGLAQRFPSWSWAACGKEVYFPGIYEGWETRRLGKLESIHGTDDNATDPLGPARIVLRGVLIPLRNADMILADGFNQHYVSWTEEVLLKESSVWVRSKTKIYPDKPVDCEAKKKELNLLPLYHDCCYEATRTEGHVYGLLLERVGTLDRRRLYRRFGMFEFERKETPKLDGDLHEVTGIEVGESGQLNYENRELDWIFGMAQNEEAVDSIPKEIYEKLSKQPQICLI